MDKCCLEECLNEVVMIAACTDGFCNNRLLPSCIMCALQAAEGVLLCSGTMFHWGATCFVCPAHRWASEEGRLTPRALPCKYVQQMQILKHKQAQQKIKMARWIKSLPTFFFYKLFCNVIIIEVNVQNERTLNIIKIQLNTILNEWIKKTKMSSIRSSFQNMSIIPLQSISLFVSANIFRTSWID